MTLTEVCGCGASIQIPAKHGMKHLREWRDTHAHHPADKPDEKHPEGNNFATIGFASSNREPELMAGKERW